jgi:integrase
MSRPVKLPSGRWTITVQDKRGNIPRTKRNFATRAECLAWEKAVRQGHFQALIGQQPARATGEALTRYLREITAHKKHPRHDHSHITALRWPAWDTDRRRWLRLEDLPLHDLPAGLALWTADMRRVARRAYHGGQHYHQWRQDDGTLAWYHQPHPSHGERPQPRQRLTDPALIAAIEAGQPRGPFDSGTLRHRQILIKHLLRIAWRNWGWIDQDLAGKITLDKPSAARDAFLDADQLSRLIDAFAAGDPDAADLITAAALIGWRRSNITYLTWDTVRLPSAPGAPDGHFWTTRETTKNGEPLTAPMGPQLEALFARRWERRNGPYVLHRGNGDPWTEFKRRWTTAKRKAGIDPAFRFHDLRHTWASHKIQAGIPDAHLQQLGGWKTPSMVRRYAHLRIEHLRSSAS